jgi:hypothetical protein
LIAGRLRHLITHDFLQATTAQNVRVLSSLYAKRVNYGVSEQERHAIESRAQALLDQLSTETADVTA